MGCIRAAAAKDIASAKSPGAAIMLVYVSGLDDTCAGARVLCVHTWACVCLFQPLGPHIRCIFACFASREAAAENGLVRCDIRVHMNLNVLVSAG